MSVPPHLLVPTHNHSTALHAPVPAVQLPFELAEALNHAYFLHLLVTQPEKVIPPGKSLLSMMTHANYVASEDDKHDENGQGKDKRQVIEQKVKEVAHRAFWDEALQFLSSSLPSVQLPRLRQLYLDLYEALAPLLPPGHPVLLSLAAPPPPTTSPLQSTIILLTEITSAIRQRCAPVRDAAMDALVLTLQNVPPTSPETQRELAQFVLDSIRTILDLAEMMREDLNTFVLGSMTESQLKGLLIRDVKKRERDLVVKLWDGQENVRGAWKGWVSQVKGEEDSDESKWLKRLLMALECDKPLYSRIPVASAPRTENSAQFHSEVDSSLSGPISQEDSGPPLEQLPPQLLFFSPTLLYLQNYIQAIVITAALRVLTHLPASSSASLDFVQRVWTLLGSEIDDALPKATNIQEEPPTKLENLADEVVRVRQLAAGSNTNLDESQIRATVDRTLRATDPVFLLLRRRLVKLIEERVQAVLQGGDDSISTSKANIPMKMQSGKGPVEERSGKRLRLMLPEDTELPARGDGIKDLKPIPGFEGPAMQRVIGEAIDKIIHVVIWTASVWGDLV